MQNSTERVCAGFGESPTRERKIEGGGMWEKCEDLKEEVRLKIAKSESGSHDLGLKARRDMAEIAQTNDRV
jgi:hypothetical protein